MIIHLYYIHQYRRKYEKVRGINRLKLIEILNLFYLKIINVL